ncbi:hypothetical protein HanRHA438_Chr04g0155351 [Helianthus annuus]|nr:hypothetical protein HanIR_Chr07g0331311 [Helianthus annuus]KAJ0586793.1 hypothetical protein HanIR_Chr04g0155811 [Helianthus annuus]KAJ0908933.1 hypothetical protein HanRHA438_Chr07g0315951 [Helianthus annuus]KAJ0925058.1 hypothetical protein HanRHA438_Chr04g0155351 [Helianthus annuus]
MAFFRITGFLNYLKLIFEKFLLGIHLIKMAYDKKICKTKEKSSKFHSNI